MSTQHFKQKVLAGAVSFVLAFSLFSASSAHANSALRSEMNKMFGTMSNATAPGVFETSRRGVISGGSLVVRNKIMNTSIVSFQPPSFNAGCGGIDMFGGSFSFINKEQFVQLARTIASNAASYAFYLALDAMSPSVRAVIDNIQKKIQELNQFFGNSCQLAQGVVNDTLSAFDMKRHVKAATSASFVGSAGDVFESFTAIGKDSPAESVPQTPGEQKAIRGNIVWDALKSKGAAAWFSYGGDNLNMAIMTATGTVIVGKDQTASDGKGKSPKITSIKGGGITLRDLIKGGEVSLIGCNGDNDKCLEPKKGVNAKLVGFREMITDNLLGDGGNPGIVAKIRQGVGLSSAEKGFIANLPESMGSMIFRLSRISEDVTRNFVTSTSEPIAREMAYEVLISFSDAAITAVMAEQENPYAAKALQELKDSRKEIYSEYQGLVDSGAKLPETMAYYNSILQAASMMGVTPDFSIAPTPTSSGN
jgi:conjugative transfer pilus assembly protein TraH